MASITFTANTYAGEELGKILAPMLLPKNGIVDRGLVSLIPNCKTKKVLRKSDIAVEVGDPSAIFSGSSGNVVLDETVLDLVKYEFQRELDFTSLITSWESVKIASGSLNDGVPPSDFLQHVENRIQSKLGIVNESLYMLGKAGTPEATFTAAYAGMLANLEASSDTIKLASDAGELTGSAISIAADAVCTVGSTANLEDGDYVTIIGANALTLVGGVPISGQTFQITVASSTTFTIGATTTGTATSATYQAQFINKTNVISHLSEVYRYIPDAVRDTAKIMIPLHVERAYKLASANVATGSGAYYIGNRELDFLGESLEPMRQFNNNEIAVWSPDNVFLGVDLKDEDQDMRIVDMRETTNSDTLRFKVGMKSDIKAAYYGETVYMRPA